MSYPTARYKSGETVGIGDHVQTRSWVELWLVKHQGRVEYVPGISKKNEIMEYGGLKWISIVYEGTAIGPLVNPKSGIVSGVHLVRRAEDDDACVIDNPRLPDDST